MTKITQMNFGEDGSRRRIHLREISGEEDSAFETVGQELRAARMRRGDDLATVSRVLKIRKDHLEAVEQDNFAGLPGKAYAIGFVRSYAGYLGLDPVHILERYKQEISGRHDMPLPTDAGLHAEDSRYLPYGWRILAGVILLALAYGAWHLVAGGPTPQPVPPPPSLAPARPQIAGAKSPPPMAPPAIDATSGTAVPPPAAGAIPGAPQPPKAEAASGPIAAAPTQGTASPAPALPAVPNPANNSSANSPAGATGSTGQVYGSNSRTRVVLRTQGDVRVTVKGPDGTVYLNRDLKA
ncbi:MAG TPA: helix-turn-helix domain-containing protein, partial [Rhizomicrobium sp.]|nr:helix-turn-helix domain-containing protein [Rhizomicrobium sp.]